MALLFLELELSVIVQVGIKFLTGEADDLNSYEALFLTVVPNANKQSRTGNSMSSS